MLIIKIDRSTVKKNPNAGNTHTAVLLGVDYNFSIDVGKVFPARLKEMIDSEIIFVTENAGVYDREGNDMCMIRGFLVNYDYLAELENIPGVSVETNRRHQILDHAPEPKYFYEYENTPVTCLSCCNKIPRLSVIEIEDDDTGNCIDKCPECGNYQSFERYQFENIDDVITGGVKL